MLTLTDLIGRAQTSHQSGARYISWGAVAAVSIASCSNINMRSTHISQGIFLPGQ